jgi:hypothetical protein
MKRIVFIISLLIGMALSFNAFADVDLLVTFSNTQLAGSDILYFQGFYNGTNWNAANWTNSSQPFTKEIINGQTWYRFSFTGTPASNFQMKLTKNGTTTNVSNMSASVTSASLTSGTLDSTDASGKIYIAFSIAWSEGNANNNHTQVAVPHQAPPAPWEEVIVTVNPKPTASLVTVSPKIVCQNTTDSIKISITKRVSQAINITSTSSGAALVTMPSTLPGNYVYIDSTVLSCGQRTYTLALPITTSSPGTQTISITGVNDGCASDALSLSLTINVIEAPTITFVNDPLCFGEAINVTITASAKELSPISAVVYGNNSCNAGWTALTLGAITDNNNGTYSSTITMGAPGTWTLHANSVTAGACTSTNPVQVAP